MENIALIAIVVLIIILALVFMLMRRNQADADVLEDEPLLPSKTEHTNSAMANQPTPMDLAEQNVPSPQFGVVAKQLMAQQRFDDAEAELLRGIHSQPNNTQLKLDLLNLYAQTSNINKFNQTYAQVQQSGDTGIISEAKHLKSLIDAEIQTRHQSESKPEPSVQSVTSDDDTPLDFNAGNIDNALDFGNEQPVAQQPMAQTQQPMAQTSDDAFNDNAFSLEDLEADLLDTTSDTTSTLDLDTNDDAGLTGDDDLTFDLDDSKPTSTSNQITSPTTAENDGLDFDFGIESTEEDHTTQSDQPSLQTDTNDDLTTLTDTLDTSDDLSFDLSEDDVVSDNLVSDVESADLSFDIESDFDLTTEVDATESAVVRDANIQDTNEVVVNDVSEISADALTTDQGNEDDSSLDDSLDFDLGSLDDLDGLDSLDDDASKVVSDSAASDSPTTHLDDTTELSNEFDLSDFGLDDDLITQDDSSQPSQSLNQQPQQPSQQDSDDRQAFDLGMDLDFDTADVSPVQSDVKAQEPSISDLTPTDPDANVASDKSNLVDLSELDVPDLDNAQITMDLAGQYIELGEYDSARRLLNEITQSANEPYLNQAKELLAQIN